MADLNIRLKFVINRRRGVFVRICSSTTKKLRLFFTMDVIMASTPKAQSPLIRFVVDLL